jgi:hypothetical protein
MIISIIMCVILVISWLYICEFITLAAPVLPYAHAKKGKLQENSKMPASVHL